MNKIKLLGNFFNGLLSRSPLSPLFVHFECTYRCNMKCSFCNIWRKNIFPNEASTLEFQKRLLESWNLGCLVVSFTGGEPLMREDLKDLMKFSNKTLGFYTGIVTNGLLLDKKIDDIAKYSDFIAVSFDVNDEKTFNETRGVDAFEKVKKNIELVKRMGIEINLFSVITRDTFKFMDSTLEFAKSLEIPIHFSPVDNVPRETVEVSGSNGLKINDISQVLEKLKLEKKKYRKMHFEEDYFNFHAAGGFNRFIRCSSASTTLALKPDASIALPCPFITRMIIEKDQDLSECFNSEEAKNMKKNCGKWDFCQGCSINCMYAVSLINNVYYMSRWIKNKI